jgi:hypothetical protein
MRWCSRRGTNKLICDPNDFGLFLHSSNSSRPSRASPPNQSAHLSVHTCLCHIPDFQPTHSDRIQGTSQSPAKITTTTAAAAAAATEGVPLGRNACPRSRKTNRREEARWGRRTCAELSSVFLPFRFHYYFRINKKKNFFPR